MALLVVSVNFYAILRATMRMDIAGPALWRGGHAITFHYPVAPSPAKQRAAAAYFEAFRELLPCEDCQQHYGRELAATPVEAAVGSRDTLSRWFVDLHNRVNARLGKPYVPYDDVAAEYLGCDMECGDTCCASTPHDADADAGTNTGTNAGTNAGTNPAQKQGQGQGLPWWLLVVAFVLGAVVTAVLAVGVCKARHLRGVAAT